MDESKLAAKIIKRLYRHDIGAYIWQVAGTGSVYVRFNDARIGSLRIANHDAIEKYKYKWNVRTDKDFKETGWKDDGGTMRLFVRPGDREILIEAICQRAKQVSEWTGQKFTYGIPSWRSDPHPVDLTRRLSELRAKLSTK